MGLVLLILLRKNQGSKLVDKAIGIITTMAKKEQMISEQASAKKKEIETRLKEIEKDVDVKKQEILEQFAELEKQRQAVVTQKPPTYEEAKAYLKKILEEK